MKRCGQKLGNRKFGQNEKKNTFFNQRNKAARKIKLPKFGNFEY